MDIYTWLERIVYVGLPVALFIAVRFDDARKVVYGGR